MDRLLLLRFCTIIHYRRVGNFCNFWLYSRIVRICEIFNSYCENFGMQICTKVGKIVCYNKILQSHVRATSRSPVYPVRRPLSIHESGGEFQFQSTSCSRYPLSQDELEQGICKSFMTFNVQRQVFGIY
jgi:hypothetical protein